MKRLAVTGSSGYLGTKLVEHLRRQRAEVEILGIDVRPPAPAEAPLSLAGFCRASASSSPTFFAGR